MSGTEDARQTGLVAYQTNRLRETDYQAAHQVALKRRAFETFDALLRHRGQRGLEAGQVLVDLGAGDGSFVRVAGDAGLAASGLDAADGIDLERDRLPIGDRSVDVVTALSVIEHLAKPSMFLGEVLRILRPSGALILVTPNWRYSQADFFDDPTHVHPYSPGSMEKVLRFHGYEQTYVGPWVVKKPAWIWGLSWRFAFARWCLPFRGDAPRWIPSFLKGHSRSILAMAVAPQDAASGDA